MWNSRYTLISLLAFALLVRGAVLIAIPSSLKADPDGYRQLAENVVKHGTLGRELQATAFRPPLYPLTLSSCMAAGPYSRAAIGLLHLALGLATVWLVFRMVERSGARGAAVVAGLLTACDPILVWQSTLVMTETMAAFWAVLTVTLLNAVVARPRWFRAAGAGACLGLAALCRPTFLPFAALVGLAALVQVWRRSPDVRRGSPDPAEESDPQVSPEQGRPALPTVARSGDRPQQESGERPQREAGIRGRDLLGFLVSGLAGLVLVLSPWVVRNEIFLGQPIVTTTHGGYTLLLGNNPFFYEYLRSGPWGVAWDVKELEEARAKRDARLKLSPDEIVRDREAYKEARENIRREPGMFVYSCIVRVGRLWSLMPHQITAQESGGRRAMRYAVGLWYLLELPLAALGVAVWIRRRGQAGWLWWILLAICFTAVHAVYWTDMRMRAPLMPGVAMAAAAGIGAMVGWHKSRKAGEIAVRG